MFLKCRIKGIVGEFTNEIIDVVYILHIIFKDLVGLSLLLLVNSRNKIEKSINSYFTPKALEGQLFKKTGKLIKLSEQNLIDCNKNEESGNWGCDVSMKTVINVFFLLIANS